MVDESDRPHQKSVLPLKLNDAEFGYGLGRGALGDHTASSEYELAFGDRLGRFNSSLRCLDSLEPDDAQLYGRFRMVNERITCHEACVRRGVECSGNGRLIPDAGLTTRRVSNPLPTMLLRLSRTAILA